jgi:hypothetical protein
MPAEIIHTRIIPEEGREVIGIMDDYGTPFQLYVAVSDAANRQLHIDAALSQQSANEAALEAYAGAHGIDLTKQKKAGLAKKAAAKGSK